MLTVPQDRIMAMGIVDRSELLMLAGFILLGWVLVRRTIRRRRSVVRQTRQTDAMLKKMRQPIEHAVPLSDAPIETQRWQVAMFDLQRELKGELDSRIAIVQSLVRQVDDRVAELTRLRDEIAAAAPASRGDAIGTDLDRLREQIRAGLAAGQTSPQIARRLDRPVGEIELIAATI